MSEAETHIITTSTPASPDEPQPVLSQEEESQQQLKEVESLESIPEPTPPVFVIQPQISYQRRIKGWASAARKR